MMHRDFWALLILVVGGLLSGLAFTIGAGGVGGHRLGWFSVGVVTAVFAYLLALGVAVDRPYTV